MLSAMAWPLEARIIPEIVISIGIVAGVAAFLAQVMIEPGAADAAAVTGADAPTTFADVSPRLVASRSLAFFGWLIAALVACWFFGILYGILLLTLAYPMLEAHERLGKVAIYATCIFLCYWLLFEEILRTPWPETLLTIPLPSIAWLKSLF